MRTGLRVQLGGSASAAFQAELTSLSNVFVPDPLGSARPRSRRPRPWIAGPDSSQRTVRFAASLAEIGARRDKVALHAPISTNVGVAGMVCCEAFLSCICDRRQRCRGSRLDRGDIVGGGGQLGLQHLVCWIGSWDKQSICYSTMSAPIRIRFLAARVEQTPQTFGVLRTLGVANNNKKVATPWSAAIPWVGAFPWDTAILRSHGSCHDSMGYGGPESCGDPMGSSNPMAWGYRMCARNPTGWAAAAPPSPGLERPHRFE